VIARDGVRLHRIHERAAELEFLPAQRAMQRVASIDTSSPRSTNEEDVANHLQKVHDSARNDLAADTARLVPELTELGRQWTVIWERWVRSWLFFALAVVLSMIARYKQ
jgi:hypothetical protein